MIEWIESNRGVTLFMAGCVYQMFIQELIVPKIMHKINKLRIFIKKNKLRRVTNDQKTSVENGR